MKQTGERRSISRILFLTLTAEGNDHSSGRTVTDALKRPNPEGESGASRAPEGPLLFGLAPGGVYPAALISEGAGERLPHLFTLTRQREKGGRDRESLFSISRLCLSSERSLFCGTFPALQRAVVNGHPAPRSPDFPRVTTARDRSISSHQSSAGRRFLL